MTLMNLLGSWTTLALLILMTGCRSNSPRLFTPAESLGTPERQFLDQEIQAASFSERSPSFAPLSLQQIDTAERRPLTVDQAVQLALQNSEVLQRAGGRVLTAPESLDTTWDTLIANTDPNLGPLAAATAFDYRFESGFSGSGGGRSFGGAFTGQPFGVFAQPATLAKAGVSKTLPFGTDVSLGALGGYDSRLASGGYAILVTSLRQPLLRGAGRQVNEIAGPRARPGTYRGVLIANLNSEKSHIDIEQSVQNLIADAVNSYWELHFAYQDLDAKRRAKQRASHSWEIEKQRVRASVSPPDFEALAQQQYYAAEAAYKHAVVGAAGHGGVYAAELRLRALLGLPASDGTLLLPVTEPLEMSFHFDWSESLAVAHQQRLELRKQKLNVRRRELELLAARNLAKWDVSLVGQYRRPLDNLSNDSELFGEALDGWQVGVEMTRTLGNRRELAAVHNAELLLSREHAVLTEQERQLGIQLRAATSELESAYSVMQSYALSRDAALVHLQAEINRHRAGDADLERVLEAQRRTSQAETAYLGSQVDYNLAYIRLHQARGTLLDTLEVRFADQANEDRGRFSQTAPTVFSKQDGTLREQLSRLPVR